MKTTLPNPIRPQTVLDSRALCTRTYDPSQGPNSAPVLARSLWIEGHQYSCHCACDGFNEIEDEQGTRHHLPSAAFVRYFRVL